MILQVCSKDFLEFNHQKLLLLWKGEGFNPGKSSASIALLTKNN